MVETRWERMWSLFHAAVELPPDLRRRFLDTECGGDTTLRGELAELLASHDETQGVLDGPPAAALAGDDEGGTPELVPGVPAPEDPLVGGRAGPYRILERIGEGGMGVVYDAEQEQPLRRRVALKVMHSGLHPDALQRFALERQALALMSHPHIARVFDAGVLPDGRLFIAMERVAGVPLNEYCDRHGLDLDGRLELFASVCQAVQHAHQKGVIHRDLKPSNVLVAVEDAAPSPKVIDFGVAKAIHPVLGDEAVRTRQELLVGTLEYMSPEQLDPSGLDIDTRSDVYSLGVVLYELVAGTLPFDWPSLRRVGLEGLRRVARQTEAPRASRRFRELGREQRAEAATRRRTSPAALQRHLAGGLDWILLKALDNDRTRRYATASELAEDLRRFRAHEPVQAGPPRASYRVGRFVRRNRAAVATTAAGAALLVAFATTTAVQSLELRRALSRADRERERAERVSQFLVDVFEASDPYEGPGREVTARAVLDRGAERVARELAGEPDVQAAVMTAIGRVYAQLGVYDEAERLLREALGLRRRLHAGDHVESAESLEELGQVLRQRADHAAAASLYEEATAMRRRLFGPRDPRLAPSLYLLGSLRRYEGDLKAAEELLDAALRLDQRTDGPAPVGRSVRAAVLEELGAVAWKKGDYGAAESRYRDALALRRREQGRETPRTAATLGRLGTLLSERGDPEAAEPLLREALELLEQHLGADHSELTPPLNNLALLLHNRGDYAGAEPLYRRSLTISRRLHGDVHPAVAINLNNLGLLLHDQNRYDEATRLFREALAIQRQMLGASHPDLAYPTTNLARVLHDQGRLREAEALYRQGLALRRKGLPADHPALADSLAWLGKLLSERDDAGAGEPLLREAVALRSAAYTADDWRAAEARSLLGGCLTRQGRYAEAEALLVESYPLMERKRGKRYRRTLEALERIVALYEAWGRERQAARHRATLERNRVAAGGPSE